MKKILILPTLIVVAGLIYGGIHFGSNSGSADTAKKPVVAGDHTVNNSGSKQPNSGAGSTGLGSGALGYSLNVGSKPNSQVASNTSKSNSSSSNTSSSSNSSSSSTSTTVTTPPATTPINPPVTPVSTVGANVVGNPSAETSTGTGDSATPTGWTHDGYGTNTPTYTYLNTGHTGSHSLQVSMSAWTNGDAKWGFTPITVTAGTSYKFSDWYESTVATEVDADFVVNGVPTFLNLGSVPAASSWTQFNTEFTVPVGATSLVVYHILGGVGSLTTDDYSLATYIPATFNRGIVTLDFDDGWQSQFDAAFPDLQADGLNATFFIISDSSVTNPDPDYMTVPELQQLQAAGNEIGDHTVDHPDLTTLTAAQVTAEMADSQTALQNALGVSVIDFAYPYGTENASTIAIGQQYFQTQRGVASGFNTKDSIDFTALKIEEVDADISVAQVQAWVDQAIAQKTWLILVWHETALTPPAGSDDDAYTTQPVNLAAELTYIKASGVAVETTNQAYNEIVPQL